MVRKLVISEEFGIYKVQAEGVAATGRTVEDAIVKAAFQRGVGEIEVRSMFDAAGLFETLLGGKRQESGLVSA